MEKLNKDRLQPIINRLVDDNEHKHHAYIYANNIILVNKQIILTISKQVIDLSTEVENILTEKREGCFNEAEQTCIKYNSPTNNILEIDREMITSIIRILDQDRQWLRSPKQAKTTISYIYIDKKLTFATFTDAIDKQEQSFYNPSYVADTTVNFSITVNTGLFLDALQTQLETGDFTTIDHYKHYIKLSNNYSAIYLMGSDHYMQ